MEEDHSSSSDDKQQFSSVVTSVSELKRQMSEMDVDTPDTNNEESRQTKNSQFQELLELRKKLRRSVFKGGEEVRFIFVRYVRCPNSLLLFLADSKLNVIYTVC